MTKNEKIAASLKEYYKENGGSPLKGKAGKKHDEATKQKIAESLRGRRRTTEAQRKARNKANVYAWRARKYNAIDESSDLELIKKIYEHCPEGYHVDHIQPLAKGGLHHQDNLQYLTVSENCRKGASTEFDKNLAIDWRTLVS